MAFDGKTLLELMWGKYFVDSDRRTKNKWVYICEINHF